MSDNPYERVKGGRLTFKGGALATSSKSIDKTKKKNKKKLKQQQHQQLEQLEEQELGENIYTIDAAKKMNYDDLFPVEAKKFGYDPKSANSKSVEQALDDRVKKKADRYCK